MKARSSLIVGCMVVVLAAPLARAYAQADPVAAADAAFKAHDYATAAQYLRTYLSQNPNAADAPKQSLRLSFMLIAAKSPRADVKAAFQAVRDRYPKTDEAAMALYRLGMLSLADKDIAGGRAMFQDVLKEAPGSPAASMARFMNANQAITQKRLDDAIDLFTQVAADSRIETAMQDEALLQTGFLPVQEYYAPTLIQRDGMAAPTPTAESQLTLLRTARIRLTQIADQLSKQTDNLKVHQTAAAYAECGIAEVLLLEGVPAAAEPWYRRAASRDPNLVQAPVTAMALQGLGVALCRQGRLADAAKALDDAIAHAATGTVLYGLLVPDFLTAQAKLWRATVAQHLGQKDRATRLAKECLDSFGGKEPADKDAYAIWLVSTNYLQESQRQERDRALHVAQGQPSLRIAAASVPTLPSPDADAAFLNTTFFGNDVASAKGGSQ